MKCTASYVCRVDPYRVICEFQNIRYFPRRYSILIGSELLNSIDEYVCGILAAPMRWIGIGPRMACNSVLPHKNCVNHR